MSIESKFTSDQHRMVALLLCEIIGWSRTNHHEEDMLRLEKLLLKLRR